MQSPESVLPPLPSPTQKHGVSSATFEQPPVDGSLMIPEIYDWHASHSPEHPLFIYPEDDGHIEMITWAIATRAIHSAGRWLLSLVRNTAFAPNVNTRPLVAILANAGTLISS